MVDHPHYRFATGTRPTTTSTRVHLKSYGIDWDEIDKPKPYYKPTKDFDYLRLTLSERLR
jgi:hypothetical protein